MPALAALAPEAVLGIILLAAFCAYLSYRGALTGWQHTFGLILVGRDGNGGIAALLRYGTTVLGHHVGFDFGGPIRAANTAIVNTLQERVADAEEDIAWTWHKMTQIWQATAEAVDWLAHETTATAHWLSHVRIPKWSKYAAIPLLLPLLIPKVIRAILPHLHANTIRVVHTVTHTITRVVVHTAAKAVAVTLPGVIPLPGIRAEIRGLTKRFARLNARLRRVEALLGATAMVAAIANALGLTVKCLRHGNLGRASRAVCGMPENLLATLLADLTAILSVVSIVEFAEELRAVEDEALAIMGALVREWPS